MKPFHVAVVRDGIDDQQAFLQPWNHHQQALADAGIVIETFPSEDTSVFDRPFDAMMLHVWLDWLNERRFRAYRLMPLLARYVAYRARFPETRQIVVNHTDMSRAAYASPYWRPGDPVLFRTPAYDRSCLAPFPASDIWPYEMIWGRPCFSSTVRPRFRAAFIGTSTGPDGYRRSVAAQVRKVGFGLAFDRRWFPQKLHDAVMSRSRIIVCPRGWGEQSARHWDAWLSGKVVLTDADCASVEMIPGVRLERNVHYLVYDDPRDIPDIVSDWTRPSRAADLAAVAENGRRAAASYDALANILAFFRRVQSAAPVA